MLIIFIGKLFLLQAKAAEENISEGKKQKAHSISE